MNDALNVLIKKLINYSQANSDLRIKYAKGIIKALSGSAYIKGELRKHDEVYDKLVSTRTVNGLKRYIEERIKN